MKITNTISAGLSKMESKLMGTNNVSSLNELETGSMSGTELIGSTKSLRLNNESTSIIIAKLFARTLLFMTLIIGLIILLSVYIQTKSLQHCTEYITTAESINHGNNNGGGYFEPLMATSESDDEYSGPSNNVRHHIPISLRMNGRAGDLMNAIGDDEKGHVNCVIERKTANQIIASEPKKLMTPFGNITTDPRLVHLTGEKLIFSCHSGDDKDKNDKDNDDDNDRKKFNPLMDKSSDDNQEMIKPVRRLIIISGPHRPIDNSINNNNNDIKDDNNKDDAINDKKEDKTINNKLNEINSLKNNNLPSPLNSIIVKRNKRQTSDQDNKNKECSCKCAC